MSERISSQTQGHSLASIVIISILGTVGLAQLMILPIMSGAFVDYRGLSDQAVGWIASANFAGIALVSIVVSLKIHHWRLVPIALIGIGVLMLADMLTLFVTDLSAILGLRFLAGIGGGAVSAAVMSAIARTAVPERGYAIFVVLQFGLAAVGLYLLPLVLRWQGIEGLLLVLLALEAATLVLALKLSLFEGEQEQVQLETEVLLGKPAMLSLLAICLFEAGNSSIWTYVERIGSATGIGAEQVGTILSLASVLSIPCAFAVVFIGIRWGRLLPLTVGIGAAAAAMIGLGQSDGTLTFAASVLLFNAAWAFTLPYFQGLQADIDHSGSVVVAGQFATMLGASLGPLMASPLVGQGSYLPAIGLAFGFYVASWLVIYPVVVLLRRHFSSEGSDSVVQL